MEYADGIHLNQKGAEIVGQSVALGVALAELEEARAQIGALLALSIEQALLVGNMRDWIKKSGHSMECESKPGWTCYCGMDSLLESPPTGIGAKALALAKARLALKTFTENNQYSKVNETGKYLAAHKERQRLEEVEANAAASFTEEEINQILGG